MLTVRDIMQTDVVTASVSDSARALARLLADEEISGAPVLDGNGRVVGVASMTDLVRLIAGDLDVGFSVASVTVGETAPSDDEDEEVDVPDLAEYGYFLPEDSPWPASAVFEQLPETTLDSATAGDVMTPASFSVEPDLEVTELCAYLVRGRIHRALVVEDGELRGIVTAQDVMRAVAEARVTL